ncbi:hypothetical protein LOTGIDRAFT_174269 [Lottia gigantea]|uniref:Uncharacterized protein n=1 Tax=Lottia gigantea TaxID=225164 RepID=V4AU54_LOTGI|nr:hypothetical protein LOTGIDRAFT_174269 [Lottia gigantea]ESO98460.1 hypothetical protein LOTGIDRAFT_174269 [Lottia gigantea]
MNSNSKESWAAQNGKGDYAVELVDEIVDKLKKRNKLIKLADRSEFRWETTRQYETKPHSNDSDEAERGVMQLKKRHIVQCTTMVEINLVQYEQGQEAFIIKGRLLANIEFRKNIGASNFIVDVISKIFLNLVYIASSGGATAI